ncbi:hypothetical protein W97_04442 [Coniosporium apollinis CBS 100218]|uniref:Uncharacterized protein n=1 Tax=Coniosporium apollinis (strain CBS 100218) TaxID=1168221 RepID=R7YTI9_CONA1|nr:uncharacterized protein W97_04442 [Coniosporium apollinis CBS 100218]EON65205.1 hypothetical protein W97_04442 [Coniosporium apollinis CBS 100218]
MERIRRRLSFTPKGSTPTERPNLENDRLRQVDRLQSQVETLTSQLKKSRQSERAMCTVVNSLKGKLDVAQMQINKDEALLEEANTRRIDLLEANSDIEELRRKYVQSQHREWELAKENELLRRQPDQSDIYKLAIRQHDAEQYASLMEAEIQGEKHESRVAEVTSQFAKEREEVRAQLQEKSGYIHTLEQENLRCRLYNDDVEHRCAELVKLCDASERQVAQNARLKSQLRASKAQNAELNTQLADQRRRLDITDLLLQGEIRKAARAAKEEDGPDSALHERMSENVRMMADIEARVHAMMAKDLNVRVYEPETDPLLRIKQLEREIDYHVRDIILYKMDVRGYKKDLKQAASQIDKLLSVTSTPRLVNVSKHPPLPSPASSRSNTTNGSAPLAGLGISSFHASSSPHTPRPRSAAADPSDLLLPHAPTDAAPTRSKTPLGKHKRLPKTPSTANSPPTASSSFSEPRTPPPQPHRLTRPKYASTPPSFATQPVVSEHQATHTRIDSAVTGYEATPKTPERGPPLRRGTERSLSESIISSYASSRSPETMPVAGIGEAK